MFVCGPQKYMSSIKFLLPFYVNAKYGGVFICNIVVCWACKTFFLYAHLKLNRIFAKRIKIGNYERKRLS